jgi:hypothetical protein
LAGVSINISEWKADISDRFFSWAERMQQAIIFFNTIGDLSSTLIGISICN